MRLETDQKKKKKKKKEMNPKPAELQREDYRIYPEYSDTSTPYHVKKFEKVQLPNVVSKITGCVAV